MRKVVDLQMKFWKTDIADINFDLQSRDEIPKLLIGLQHIYCTPKIRDEGHPFKGKSKKTKGSGAVDKAAIQQVNEGGSPRKSCRVNCPVRTRSDAGACDR